MKKFLIILTLTLLQCACATPGPASNGGRSLLSFKAISAEITVTHVETEVATDLSQTVALNIDN
jgi:hypothetical protein